MADPLITTPSSETIAEAARSEQQAVLERQAFEATPHKKAQTIVLPGGQRRTLSPNVGARYTLIEQAKMLGDAPSILTDEYLRSRQGWKFEWPIADSDETRSMLRNGQYEPVPPSAIRQDIEYALVGDSLTSKGECISWKRHLLVAVPPTVWKRRHVDPVNYALERTAQGEDVAAQLDSQFAQHGFRAEVEAFKDRREESI